MFELYPKFFGYLGDRSRDIERQLNEHEALDFSSMLRRYPVIDDWRTDMGAEYGRFLRYLIRFGVSTAGLEPFFNEYFNRAQIDWAKSRAAPVRLDVAFGKGKLSADDVVLMRHGYTDAIDLAKYLETVTAPDGGLDAIFGLPAGVRWKPPPAEGADDGFESMLHLPFGGGRVPPPSP
ncbi:hypothetical protein, partial [Variovorax sp. KK3]